MFRCYCDRNVLCGKTMLEGLDVDIASSNQKHQGWGVAEWLTRRSIPFEDVWFTYPSCFVFCAKQPYCHLSELESGALRRRVILPPAGHTWNSRNSTWKLKNVCAWKQHCELLNFVLIVWVPQSCTDLVLVDGQVACKKPFVCSHWPVLQCSNKVLQ